MARRIRRRGLALEIYTGVVLVFLFLPLSMVALYAFHSEAALGLPFRGFSLRWFEDVADDDQLRAAGRNSVQVSLVAGLVVTVIGTMAAIATTRYRFRGRTAARALIMVPIALPALLYSVSLLAFYSQRGIALSLWTATLGHVIVLLPLFYLIVATRLSRFDPLLEEAARDLGATPWQSFRRVMLPIVAPTILGAALLTVASSWDELIISLFNAGTNNTIPMLIYTRIRVIVEPSINAIALLLLLVTAVVLILTRRIVSDLGR